MNHFTGITQKHIDFLLKCTPKIDFPKEKSLDILDTQLWESLCFMSDLDGLNGFADKI